MPSSITFIGSGFFVEAAQSQSPGVVRIFYSNVPIASNPAGPNDALNPVNYTLSGPGPGSVESVAPVSGNPMAFDLTTVNPLHIGTWTVTVSNVEDIDTMPMEAPFAAVFTVTVLFAVPTLAQGAQNDPPDQIIRKHLSQAMKGPNWDALILALSTGDDANWQNAQSAFDQLFTSTASGSWLEKRANDEGIQKPVNVGMADNLFRQYVIKFSTSKVVHEAIREILEVFYGRDAERAFVESGQGQPYNLSANPNLTWTLDEKETFSIVFTNTEFNQPSAASAVEVAAILTEQMQLLGSDGFAIPFTNPQTGQTRVRIYSGSLGLGSFARVTGGMAQNVFQFPSIITTYTGTITGVTGYNWVYTNPNPTTTRATLTIDTSVSSPLITLTPVNGDEGDYVVITADAGIGVTGTFPVTNVLVSYSGTNLIQSFDIPLIPFTGTALQQANDAYTFYQPVKNSIFAAGSRTVLVAQPGDGQLDISLPATTQAVNRGPKHAFYGRVEPSLGIRRVQRLPGGTAHVITAANHGLSMGSQVQLDGIIPNPNRPWITPGVTGSAPAIAINPASYISISNASQTPPQPGTIFGAAATLPNGQLLFTGGVTYSSGTSSNELATCDRFQSNGFTAVIDGTEANGANQYSYQWIATASMNAARYDHGMSVYSTGAMVTGGFASSSSTTLASAETYTPNAWTTIASMNHARAGHGQLTLPNGEVLVVSGNTGVTAELYNGTSWAVQGSLTYARAYFPVVQLKSTGQVIAIGGQTNYGFLPLLATNTIETSVDNGVTWLLGGAMTYARSRHQATLLPGDFILVTGGHGYNPTLGVGFPNAQSLNTVEIYDPRNGRWESQPNSGIRRHGHQAIYDAALNQVIVFGGISTQGDDVTVVEIFDVAKRKWKTWPSKLSTTREYAVGGQAGDQLVTMGGVGHTFPSPHLGHILDSNVFALWRAEDNTDAAGHYNLSTSSGGAPIETPGQINNAFFLDPSVSNQGYYAAVTHSDILTLRDDSYTVESWIFPRNTSVGGFILIVNGVNFSFVASDTVSLEFGLDAGGKLYFSAHQNTSTSTGHIESVGSIPAGQWSHVALVRTAQGGNLFTYSFYINGRFDSSTANVLGFDSTTHAAIGGTTQYACIGGYVASPFPGTQSPMPPWNWDDTRWSTVARTANEIATSYERGLGNYTTFGTTTATAEVLTPGSNTVSGGSLNGQFAVSSVISLTEFTVDTSPKPEKGYMSTMGPAYSGQATQGGFWNVSSGTRASNVVTLTLTLPSGVGAQTAKVGDLIWLNSEDNTDFPNGFKVVTASTATSVSYNEVGANVTASFVGAISQSSAPNAVETPVAALPQTQNDPGPYLYDPFNGVAVTDISSTTSGFVLNKDQQYGTIEVSGIGQFPDEQGWIVIGFGTPQQTIPIKLLGTYADTPSTTKLIIDFTYVFTTTFPIGSNVTLLSQRGAFVPEHPEQVGSAYITDSSSGRIAAIAAIDAAVAAGFETTIRIVYPGDRGLGGEGFPTFDFDPKLSDIVAIYAGDDINADENAARAEPGVPVNDRPIRSSQFPHAETPLPNVPAPTTWVLGPTMNIDRASSAAITLVDGRILISGGDSGGYGGPTQTTSCDLLSANGQTITAAAPMNTGRSDHITVLLSDGRVLAVAGGTTLTCEIYDPVANTWTNTASIPATGLSGMIGHHGTLLADGTVLVVGGCTNFPITAFTTNSTWRYDPIAGTWSTGATIPGGGLALHCQYLLPGGMKVLVATGIQSPATGSDQGTLVSSAYIYDVNLNTWISVANVPGGVRCLAHGAVLLDGRCLIAGGTNHISNSVAITTYHDAYTFNGTAWVAVGNMTYPRENNVGSGADGQGNTLRFADGRVFIGCGQSENNQFSDQTQATSDIFNPSTNTWSPGPTMPIRAGEPTLALLGVGSPVFCGGDGDDNGYLPMPQTYQTVYKTPVTTAFVAGPAMAAPRIGAGLLQMIDGRIMVVGGDTVTGGGGQTKSAQILKADGSGFTTLPNTANNHAYFRIIRIPAVSPIKYNAGDKALVIAGTTSLTVEIYDPSTNAWTTTNPYPIGSVGWEDYNATNLLNGKVLVCGGHDTNGSIDITDATNIWDQGTGLWTAAASMNERRANHACVLLSDGRVFVAGGLRFDGEENVPTDTAEIYDPVADTWTLVSSMGETKVAPLYALLNDGTILVTGGSDNVQTVKTLTQVYNVNTDTWTTVQPMPVPVVNYNGMIPQPIRADGKVVVFCGNTLGISGGDNPTNTVQLYDPVAQTWSLLPSNPITIGEPAYGLIGGFTIYSFGGDVNDSLYQPTTDTFHSTPVK